MEFITPVITFLSTILAAYVISKIFMKNIGNIIEDEKNFIIEDVKQWLQTEEAAKLIYQIGVLIGNGAKSGIGINARGGKMKIGDLVMQGIAAFIEGKTSGPKQQQSGEKDLYPSKY